jgi:hypothetical protein
VMARGAEKEKSPADAGLSTTATCVARHHR